MLTYKRQLGLDIGDVRIGVAISDLMGLTANPRETYTRKKDDIENDITYFCEYAKREDVDAFVLGLPKNMDGTEGNRAIITREFGDMLAEKSGLAVKYQDERLTTVSAERMLIDADVRRDKRKLVIDKVAATIILQSYLDGKMRF
ncbi:MAG: Holliday junction resolvase RuvX [Clostridia bacterium]